MFEFLFPASMAAGGVLVSSPIIIHLINRMRFKRIRWAAMEFLLKSQKRNRRRLIIEQLILLLLRIILVLLIALILARVIGELFGAVQPQTTQHIILFDDTPSMNDQWLDAGERRTSFKEARRLIVEDIARNAAKASKAQQLKLFTVTQPDQLRFDQRLNDQSTAELGKVLAGIEPSALHKDLIGGVHKANEHFSKVPQDQRILYLVSDFRQTDWTGPAGDALLTELAKMRQDGVHVKFVDVADPPRKEGEKDPRFHDNLAIVQVRPESRVTARNRLTEFIATVVNHSLIERKNAQLRVKVNGVEQPDRSVPIPLLRPNERTEVRFHVYLDQTGLNQVSANFDPEDTGLLIDNTRHAVVEVRERVPILLVDGDPAASRKEGGDAYFLQLMFNANRGVAAGYDLILGTLSDLERPNLDHYPSLYLVNVRELNDKALAALKRYVEEGGNVAFFLGERVNPEFYNRKLYDDGRGIFPVPLQDRASPELSPEEKAKRVQEKLNDSQYELFVRNPTHPIFAAVWDEHIRGIFMYVNIERYWPVARTRWTPTPGKTEELVTLPNRQSVDDYKDQVQDLLAKLPLDNPDYKSYSSRLTWYRDTIRDILTGKPLHRLATTIDQLLRDPGQRNNPDLPNLTEFWSMPDPAVNDLYRRFDQLRHTVTYGDPLVVTGLYGKGRSIAWLTTIGRRWNNWAGDFPVSATFPVVMFELQRWLIGGSSNSDLLVGTPLQIQLDATRYEDRMRRIFRPESKEQAAGAGGDENAQAQPGVAPGDVVMGEQQGRTDAGRVLFSFTDALKPGVYILEFMTRPEGGAGEARREQRGFAFNIDTTAESNLMRIDRGLLEQKVPGSQFYTLGSDKFSELEQRQRDLSEGPWLFLIFLVVLVLEQALAVHLSYHVKGAETAAPVPAPQPQAV